MNFSFNKLAITVGLSCAIAAPLASAGDNKFELNLGLGHYLFEEDRNLDDNAFWGAGLGYVIDPSWTVEAWFTDSNLKTDPGGIKVDGQEYRLDALYHLKTTDGLTPYIVAGVGDMSYDTKFADSDETRINVGFGLKKAFTERLSLRGDMRLFNSLDNELTDAGVQLGLNYKLGAMAPKVVDSDGDGVEDGIDACPDTPAGVSVDAKGCPLDSDGDGVYDYRDKCPNTAANLKVDADGCPLKLKKAVSIELKVSFDNNSDVVKPQYVSEIKRVADFMKDYASTRVEIQGHTDSYGAADYNMSLSQRRADAVAKILVNEYGVNASRVTAKGYGEEQPVASDKTREGREANRRVVAHITAQVETLQQK